MRSDDVIVRHKHLRARYVMECRIVSNNDQLHHMLLPKKRNHFRAFPFFSETGDTFSQDFLIWYFFFLKFCFYLDDDVCVPRKMFPRISIAFRCGNLEGKT